jgi:anti-sigma factor RsiW
MNHHPEPDPRPAVPPEWLAGYADGELDADHARRVEEWLVGRPDAASDLEAQRRLSPRNRPFWQAVAPPRPSDDAWAAVNERIARGVTAPAAPKRAPRPGRAHWPFRLGLVVACGVGTAAAAAALFLTPGPVAVPPAGPQPVALEALPITLADDVEIHSLRSADVSMLVVGQPPDQGPFILAAADDIALHTMEPGDGAVPRMPPMTKADVPMVVAGPSPR